MDRGTWLLVIVGLCVANGILSPLVVLIAAQPALWFLGFVPPTPSLLFYFSSLLLATLTLIFSGVPAALYERVTGRAGSDVAMVIWLVAAAILSLPMLSRVARM